MIKIDKQDCINMGCINYAMCNQKYPEFIYDYPECHNCCLLCNNNNCDPYDGMIDPFKLFVFKNKYEKSIN